MKWICMNSFMYADDLIILAISLSDLEYLLNLCVGVFKTLGMEINTKKTSCIRIGPRHNVSISNVFLNGQILLWNQELNYLGIVLCSAKKFTVNQQKCKQKFFKSINGIFGKVGLNSSLPVLSSLIETCCLPSLLYASECLTWNASMLRGCKMPMLMCFLNYFTHMTCQRLPIVSIIWE